MTVCPKGLEIAKLLSGALQNETLFGFVFSKIEKIG